MESEDLTPEQDSETEKPNEIPFEELTDERRLNLLIKSNMENGAASKDLVNQLAKLNQNFKNIVVTKDMIEYGIELERQEFADAYNKYKELKEAFPTKLNAELSDESKAVLSSFESKLKWLKTPVFLQYGLAFLSAIILTLTLILSAKFYKESIRTRSEVRTEILQELKEENKGVYDQERIRALEKNTKIMQEWIKRNPKDSKGLVQYADGYKTDK